MHDCAIDIVANPLTQLQRIAPIDLLPRPLRLEPHPAARPSVPRPRLAELLLRRGAVTADQLAVAAEEHRQRGGRFCAVLLQLGFVSDTDLARCFNEDTESR